MTNLSDLIKEIKNLAKDFKSQNGNSAIKISNKEFNLWLAQQIYEMRQDINSNRIKIKMLCWVVGFIVAGLIGLMAKLV